MVLPLQHRSGRVVRAVHLGMAVHAVPCQYESADTGAATARTHAGIVRIGITQRESPMPRIQFGTTLVTLLTEMRTADCQHAWHAGAVRCVAQVAVLADRLVLPQEGASFIRMTVGAGLRHREALDVCRTRTTMGLVAVAAGEFFLFDRVRVWLQDFAAHLLVATKTDIRFRLPLDDEILAVNAVAGSAGEISTLMPAAVP